MNNRGHYERIVLAFANVALPNSPLIGDCESLAHPKHTILYAISWLIQDAEETEWAEEKDKIKVVNTYKYLLTILARDWHEIDVADKNTVARLKECKSFPDWAMPLKHKYINEEKASKEAFDAAFEAMKDKTEAKKSRGVSSEQEYGNKNEIVTRECYEAAKKRLRDAGLLGEQT